MKSKSKVYGDAIVQVFFSWYSELVFLTPVAKKKVLFILKIQI